MTGTEERYCFLAALVRREKTIPHNPIWVAQRLMRLAATAQRLAIAQCNGDWPADGGVGKWPTVACSQCENHWATVTVRKGRCGDCRVSEAITICVAAELPGWTVNVGGDPRGWVVRLIAPDGTEIGVPA